MITERHRVEVMHGVNLDQLGRRDPEHYGTLTLDQLEDRIGTWASAEGLQVSFFRTNHEGEFVEHLHGLDTDAVILNPGAWTHYAWAIRDALELTGLPAIEVHLSDVKNREEFRRLSVLEGVVFGSVRGEGPEGYGQALTMIRERLG